jgi:sugar phosphate permease
MIGEVIGQVPVADLVDTFSWPKVVFASGLVGLLIGIVMLLVIPRRPSWFKDRFKHDQEIQVSLLKSLGLILKNPQIWIVGCISAILYLPLSVIAALWGTSYLGKTMDLDISDASLCMSMLAVGWLIGCPIVGKLSDISQNRRIPLLLGSIGGFITMGLFLMAQNMNLTSMMILTFVMGLVTSTQTLAFAVSIELSPRALAATAISICNFLTMLIAAALQNAIGWILNWRIDSNMKHGDYIGPLTTHPLTHSVHEVQNSSKGVYANVSVSDFTWAIAVIPVLFLVAIVLCFFLKETHARKVSEVDPD